MAGIIRFSLLVIFPYSPSINVVIFNQIIAGYLTWSNGSLSFNLSAAEVHNWLVKNFLERNKHKPISLVTAL